MKKIVAGLFLALVAPVLWAEGYGGVGVGLSEACVTKYQPSFTDGDCIDPNLTIRGMLGGEINEYFSLEGSVDFSFDAGNVVDIVLGKNNEDSFFYDPDIDSNRWSILTLAVHPLVYLPIAKSFRLFAGPSFGGSMVNFDYDVKYFGNNYGSSHSSTEFGLNYGWTAGVDLMRDQTGFMRLQWQNWRSLDANVAVNSEFNSNTLTFNIVSYF